MLFGIALILIILLTLISGMLYEYFNHKNVRSKYPPDGQMIDVGNREIHLNVKGSRTDFPPVVIEAGTGNWSYDWSDIQKELSQYTQVITYDRAGYGWSDAPSDGFSLDETVSDLNTVIEEADINIPVIIIAHSVGGVYARHFIDRHPEKTAGLILVDSRNEYFKNSALQAYNEAFIDSQSQMLNKVLAKFGVVRIFGENTLQGMPEFISKEKYANVQYDVPFFKVMDEEIKQIPRNVDRLNDLQSLRNKPLTIITPKGAGTQAEELGFSKEQEKILNQQWFDSQKHLTNLSINSKFIAVPDSSHAVMYDKPDIIIKAVLDMADEIKINPGDDR